MCVWRIFLTINKIWSPSMIFNFTSNKITNRKIRPFINQIIEFSIDTLRWLHCWNPNSHDFLKTIFIYIPPSFIYIVIHFIYRHCFYLFPQISIVSIFLSQFFFLVLPFLCIHFNINFLTCLHYWNLNGFNFPSQLSPNGLISFHSHLFSIHHQQLPNEPTPPLNNAFNYCPIKIKLFKNYNILTD
jgi:hypothetical protein